MKQFFKGFKDFGHIITNTINFILLTIVYILGIGLTSILSKIFKKNLQIIKEKTQATQLYFLIIPSKANFLQSTEFNYTKKYDKILEYCSELDLNCIDFKETIDNPDDIYYKEGHLNQKGHYKIAKLIYDFLGYKI